MRESIHVGLMLKTDLVGVCDSLACVEIHDVPRVFWQLQKPNCAFALAGTTHENLLHEEPSNPAKNTCLHDFLRLEGFVVTTESLVRSHENSNIKCLICQP